MDVFLSIASWVAVGMALLWVVRVQRRLNRLTRLVKKLDQRELLSCMGADIDSQRIDELEEAMARRQAYPSTSDN